MKQYKKMLAFFMTAVFTVSNAFSGFAAVKKEETRIPITTVSLNVISKVEADTEISEATVLVTSNSDLYFIGGYEWVGAKDIWKIGDEPKIKVEVHAKNGYYFDRVSGAKKITINGGEFGSGKTTNEKETVEVTIKLPKAGGTLEEPDNADWAGYPAGKAKWDPVEGAGAYELRLYKEGQMIYSVEKVTSTTYDFLPYMTEGGRYYYTVRAIAKNTEEEKYIESSYWIESDDTSIDDDEASPFYGVNTDTPTRLTPNELGWQLNGDGKWYYRNMDGTYPRNQWLPIDGFWYLFDSEGFMLTGWQFKDQNRYYLNGNGQMHVGWLQEGKDWYYLNADGSMHVGWLELNGQWYYMNQDGIMQNGWVLSNGRWYYMDPANGIMVRNMIIEGHYIDAEGVMIQ